MWRGILFCLLSVSLWAEPASFEQASKLYHRTDYEGSLRLLLALPDKDGPVYDLIGRNQFMLGEFKKASESYQQALAADPSNSEYEHWLGKALGKRAETASPFTAPGGFLGGGLDKAARLAESIAALDPAEGLWAQARIAERRKDYGKAEEQLRRAMQAAPMQVGRVVDLAKFLSKQGRIEESEQTFRAAEQIAPNNPRLLYSRAETYIKARRNIETARELLKRYLSANLSPDDPSRQDAEKLLKQAGS